MPFADYFGSWLFGLVADRATRWFTNALIGDEVDRAIRQAALAAAGCAAQELLPDDLLDRDRAAGLLIEAIDAAFAGAPDDGLAESGAATLLEAVNSGIAARILPLAELGAGNGGSLPTVRVAAPAVARQLSTQLVREIIVRGARGGPLKPLADQLNHEFTRLQGQQALAQGQQALAQGAQALAQGEQTLAMLEDLVESVARILAHLDEAKAGPRALSTLPPDAAWFTGREAEIDRLIKNLHPDAVRPGVITIDTIDGMAGVGKTALAVHVAHLLAQDFIDGQLYVHLHGHTPDQRPVNPLYALSALLLETDFPPDRIPRDLDECAAVWRAHMADRKILLILDDAYSTEQVQPLLPGGTGSLVLITSRHRLTIAGARALTLDVLPPDDAVRMLVRLADRDDLQPDDPALAEIVRLCGYLPLAISMMAAQLQQHRTRSPANVAASLSARPDRLSLMVAENLSVARAVDLSYRQLGLRQRRLFRQLSLCPGADFDVYAAAAIDGAELKATARRLNELFEYNLLRENSSGRYSFHDLVREHARALAAGDSSMQARMARRRLFDYYLHTARAADRYLSRRTASGIPLAVARRPVSAPEIRNWQDAVAWLDAEHLNVYAVARYASLNGWPEHSVAIAAAVFAYLRDTGNWNEARELTGAALRSAEATGRRAALPTLLHDVGNLQYVALDLDASAQTSAETIDLARDLADPIGEANARIRLVAVLAVRRQTGETALQLDVAQRLYQDRHDLLGQAYADLCRGIVQHQTGELSTAEQSIGRALEGYRSLGIRMGEAEALGDLAGIEIATGRYEAAEARLREALDIHRQLGDRRSEAGDLYYLGAAQREARKFDIAAETLSDALRLYRESGESFGEAGVLNQLGQLEVEQASDNPLPAPDQERARTYLTAALDIYRSAKSDLGQAEVLNNLARLALAAGNTAEARACLARVLQQAGMAEPERARALEGLGVCQLNDGDRDQGLGTLHDALEIYRAIKSPHAGRVEKIINDLRRAG